MGFVEQLSRRNDNEVLSQDQLSLVDDNLQ